MRLKSGADLARLKLFGGTCEQKAMILKPERTTSLSYRFGFAVAAIALLGFVSIVTAVMVIQRSGQHVAAVNAAGSLRMQTYRIGSALLNDGSDHSTYVVRDSATQPLDYLEELRTGFSARLDSGELRELYVADRSTRLGQAYDKVEQAWRSEISPILKRIQRADPGSEGYQNLRSQYLVRIDGFVSDIDEFVLELQISSQQKIRLLGIITLFCVFGTVGVAYLVMYLLNTTVVIPLKDLVDLASQFMHGNLTARSLHRGKDELGILAHTYNEMADSIANQYKRLENMVAEKTLELRQSNMTLEFLYATSMKLAGDRKIETICSILDQLRNVSGVQYIVLFFKPTIDAQSYDWVESGKTDNVTLEQLKENTGLLGETKTGKDRMFPVIVHQLIEGQQQYGYMFADPGIDGSVVSAWKQQLIRNVADQLAAAFSLQHQETQKRLLILLEERAVIARELHDSLAQSLSYIKVQVSRLRTLLDRKADQNTVMYVTHEIQDGLNAAYRNLRELLNTFRLKVSHPSLQAALQATVDEFSEFSNVLLCLNYDLTATRFSPNEDIHVLQIVREAVSNAVKHAAASCIKINCYPDNGDRVIFEVCDDGIGIGDNAHRKNHHGLYIMRERAVSLGGELSVQSTAVGGTRVLLMFVPDSMVVNAEIES